MNGSKINKTTDKIQKRFDILDMDSLQDEFYRTYDPDYWLYKISLLKNSHDNFDEIKNTIKKDLSNINEDDYKRMLRTEMHFLYFQMTETLFEIIFALAKHDNRNLWIALTFSNERDTEFYSNAYSEIKKLSITGMKTFLYQKISTVIQGKKIKIPLVRWLFYFIYPSKMTDSEWVKNLENIERMLKIFSQDFSERAEYNAYKHSLRFYNSDFALALTTNNMKQVRVNIPLGKSKDSIIFLEEYHKHDYSSTNISRIARTIKPFDFERDTRCCCIIYSLIKNMVFTRKYSLLKDHIGKEFDFSTYTDIKLPEVLIPKTGITKSSFTV